MWSTRVLNRLRRWWLEIEPEWLLAISFGVLIGVGTAGLLWLPGLYTGPRLSLADAFFTATSAATVTGLAVVDTATHFTRWGQAWLLLLVQLGGLGLIGITSAIIGAMGSRLSLRTEMLMVPSMERFRRRRPATLTQQILKFTLAVEVLTAVVLWVCWIGDYGVVDAAWHAVFHAVNAFCSGGFSTFSDSLMGQATHPLVLFTLSVAAILGGLGYLSTMEFTTWLQERRVLRTRRLSVHTWAAVTVSAVLLVVGAVTFAILERNGVLAGFGPLDRAANAWFMSSMRSAGFNSVPYDQIGNDSALFTLFLMFVGGSPGSTAGGVKTTALAILIALAIARIRGRRFVPLYNRTVPDGTVAKTVSLLILFVVLLVGVNALLALTEGGHHSTVESRAMFLPLLFESVSAVGTVGLSMGMTPSLSDLGKALLSVAMFIGRVGPLSFFVVISVRASIPAGLRPATEDLIVG